MAKFRADFDVKGSLVLPVGQAELTFRGADRKAQCATGFRAKVAPRLEFLRIWSRCRAEEN